MHELKDFYKDLLSEPHLNNRAGDPKYPNYNHLGIEWGSHDTNNSSRSGSVYSGVTHRQGSKPKWFHNRILPLLLANVKGGSVVVGGGITQLRQSSSNTKFHFPYSNFKRRKGHKFEELQTHSSLQCDIQNHFQGHSSKTQSNSTLHHLQGSIGICSRKENHG